MDGSNSPTIAPVGDRPYLPTVVIACQVLQDLLERLLPAELAEQVTFMDYGMHRAPSEMTWTLQETIDSIPEPSLLVLGYGLCGNGLNDLRSEKHTLLIPRTHDCIALLLGSYQAYLRESRAVPGTYYLTKGWLESGSNPLKEYEEYRPKYGDKKAMWIMDQQYRHYERLVLVAHTQADMEKYRAQAQEIGQFCQRWNMRYEEILGSDDYVRRLVEAAVELKDGSLPPDRVNGDFVLIAPYEQVRQGMFIR